MTIPAIAPPDKPAIELDCGCEVAVAVGVLVLLVGKAVDDIVET